MYRAKSNVADAGAMLTLELNRRSEDRS
jgi:hypothetical protein